MTIDNRFLQFFKEYQQIPNAPLAQQFTVEYIRGHLHTLGIEYDSNKYYILIKPKSINTNNPKLLIIAHLDHPGIVFKNNKQAKLLGLISTNRLAKRVEGAPLPIRVFNRQGELLGKALVTQIRHGHKHEVQTESTFDIPMNSIGMFDVESYKEFDNTLEVYNADDGVFVAAQLYLLQQQLNSSNFNTYFAFMINEEIHQLSAWHFARNNPIGLTDKDYILNLECLKIESVDSQYGVVDYAKGPVLQLSNTGCLFGYKNPGPNMLELQLRSIAREHDLQLQIGIIKDSCDSRPFSQFAISPNICTLTIPNRYKHNGADDGDIRPEVIEKKDVHTALTLLQRLITEKHDLDRVNSRDSVSQRIKEKDRITDLKLMRHKRILNNRLAIAYRSVVQRGYFYPETLQDRFLDFLYKSISYLVYFVGKTCYSP